MFNRLRNNRDQRGFTLIELLIVMALLGVLVAVLLPRYQDLTPEAKVAATQANLESIRSAVLLYSARNPNSPIPQTWSALIDQGFLRRIPPDKITGSTDTAKVSLALDQNVTLQGGGGGGWILNTLTGTVFCNLSTTTLGTGANQFEVNPFTDW